MGDVSLAFLILAHDQPEHLGRLVGRLDDERHTFFIHIDAKSDLREFVRAVKPAKSVAVFLQGGRRQRVNWGGFSMLKATLHLIDCALEKAQEFDYFCLLSGSDYLVKPLPALHRALTGGKEFLRIDRALSGHRSPTHSRFVEHYFFNDSRLLQKLRLSGRFRRRVCEKLPLYHGSQWWTLSAPAVRYVMDFVKENPEVLEYFRYVHCSDEIFFGSVLKTSPFSDRIVCDFERDPVSPGNVHGLHYIDWENPSNDARSPKVLVEEDFQAIAASDAVFARKFRGKISSALLRRLDRLIGSAP